MGKGTNIPLEIDNHHPVHARARARALRRSCDLADRNGERGAIGGGNPVLAPGDRAAGGGVVGDALGARKGWHRRHVDDAVLEQD